MLGSNLKRKGGSNVGVVFVPGEWLVCIVGLSGKYQL